MDVKQIRDEIAKIESLLATVDADILRLRESEPEAPEELIQGEYMTMLQSLSTAPAPAGFPSMDDSPTPVPAAPDAFSRLTA